MSNGATAATQTAISSFGQELPLSDTQDYEDVQRGFIARSAERQVLGEDGHVVWDLDAYAFTDGPCPETANPSLWRQVQLMVPDGLFEVVPGIYQVRGYDLSVMSLIEGESGVIVVDPLISTECAAAAFALYSEHRGNRPVTGMIYTHSHIDHFAGVKGIISTDDVRDRDIPVIAPAGFMDHAASEMVYAGTAMARRSAYHTGADVPKGPQGHLSAGLGLTTSQGTTTLIPPTVDITETGQELVVDGVRIVFQVTPGTEAPAEMNFFFPDHKAICMAENTSHTLHNILTLRGAEVRDARAWARYLTETLQLWGDGVEAVFASHHWPTWGHDRCVGFMEVQRDMYAYLHDQTLRMLNQGLVGSEIAEAMEMPPALAQQWHTHGYYGSVSHDVKAIYQRYMGWYDGNPAHLWAHPPVEAARRYVAAMGGADGAVATARQSYADGDYRWVVELLNHVLFADEHHAEARSLQADAFEQLGYGCENGTWRSSYLAAATELREGNLGTPTSGVSPDLVGALTLDQLFATIAARVDGPRAWDHHSTIRWTVGAEGTVDTELRNGALIFLPAPRGDADTTVTLDRPMLVALLFGTVTVEDVTGGGSALVSGDAENLATLFNVLSAPDPDFAIVTP